MVATGNAHIVEDGLSLECMKKNDFLVACLGGGIKMEKTVRDLKIGNFGKTRVIPETQRYFSELMEIFDIYGKESDEYKTVKKNLMIY